MDNSKLSPDWQITPKIYVWTVLCFMCHLHLKLCTSDTLDINSSNHMPKTVEDDLMATRQNHVISAKYFQDSISFRKRQLLNPFLDSNWGEPLLSEQSLFQYMFRYLDLNNFPCCIQENIQKGIRGEQIKQRNNSNKIMETAIFPSDFQRRQCLNIVSTGIR